MKAALIQGPLSAISRKAASALHASITNRDVRSDSTLPIWESGSCSLSFFVGKDVAEALGYSKSRNALAAHVDEEDKTTALIQGGGSNYKSLTVIINESGLYSLVLESVSCYTTTQIAKELGMTVYDLTRELIGRKVMYKQSGQYMLYAEYARKGYARSRTHLRHDSEGNVYTEMYLVWTEEGREFIHRLIETPPETQSQEELIQLELAFSA